MQLKGYLLQDLNLECSIPPEKVKYSRIPISENDSKEHRELALKAAEESIVLLKNKAGILPLKKELKNCCNRTHRRFLSYAAWKL